VPPAERAQAETETLSDVVPRVVKPRPPVTDFVGIWKEVRTQEVEAFQRLREKMSRTEVAREGPTRKARRQMIRCAGVGPVAVSRSHFS
jgi:hypothetical protein